MELSRAASDGVFVYIISAILHVDHEGLFRHPLHGYIVRLRHCGRRCGSAAEALGHRRAGHGVLGFGLGLWLFGRELIYVSK